MPKTLIDGKSCFYQDSGKGFPLLLGHSYLWSSKMWAPQIEELSQEFRCIVPDLWDHGESDSLEDSSVSMELLAQQAWKLMESLGISEFAVVGLSVGGMWGAELAYHHPEAIKALVLMDTFVGSEPEATKEKYFALLDSLEQAKGFSPSFIDQITPLFFSPVTQKENPKLVSDFKAALSHVKEEKIAGIVALGRAIFSRECRLNRLSKLKAPVMILVGEDDIPRPPKEAREMASFIPESEIRVIERAGHISNLEQSNIVTNLLKGFLHKALLVDAR